MRRKRLRLHTIRRRLTVLVVKFAKAAQGSSSSGQTFAHNLLQTVMPEVGENGSSFGSNAVGNNPEQDFFNRGISVPQDGAATPSKKRLARNCSRNCSMSVNGWTYSAQSSTVKTADQRSCLCVWTCSAHTAWSDTWRPRVWRAVGFAGMTRHHHVTPASIRISLAMLSP